MQVLVVSGRACQVRHVQTCTNPTELDFVIHKENRLETIMMIMMMTILGSKVFGFESLRLNGVGLTSNMDANGDPFPPASFL